MNKGPVKCCYSYFPTTIQLFTVFQKIVFYCHFPDKLLTKRQGTMKKIYRYGIDWVEEVTTGMADKILVNSKFTGKKQISSGST